MSIIFISQVGNRDIYWDKAQRGEATCLGSHQGFWQRHDLSRSSELWASALNYQPSSALQHLALPSCRLFAPSETHPLMNSNLFLNITYGLQLQMKISALQSYFTYPVILIEYWAKWLIRSLQGTVCLILFWNVCLHKCHKRKSLEATIICNVKIFRFLWSFPSPEGSNSSPLVDKSSSSTLPPHRCLAEIWPSSCPGMQTSDESDFPQENAAALFLRHTAAWITQLFLQWAASSSMSVFTVREYKGYGLDLTWRLLNVIQLIPTEKHRLQERPALHGCCWVPEVSQRHFSRSVFQHRGSARHSPLLPAPTSSLQTCSIYWRTF